MGPFLQPAPFSVRGDYIRKSMLLSLATHFETTNMEAVESWVADHGFDKPLDVPDSGIDDAACQVLMAVELSASNEDELGDVELGAW